MLVIALQLFLATELLEAEIPMIGFLIPNS